jgi:hypothetical protein
MNVIIFVTDFICSCGRFKSTEQLSGKLFRKCECEENKLVSDFEKINIKQVANNAGCNCECKNSEEIPNKRFEYNNDSKQKIQPCFWNKAINNFSDCCIIKSKDQRKKYIT